MGNLLIGWIQGPKDTKHHLHILVCGSSGEDKGEGATPHNPGRSKLSSPETEKYPMANSPHSTKESQLDFRKEQDASKSGLGLGFGFHIGLPPKAAAGQGAR